MKIVDTVISKAFRVIEKDSGAVLNVSSIGLNEHGEIDSVTYTDEGQIVTKQADQVIISNLVLCIPGIGHAHPGDILYLKNTCVNKTVSPVESYILRFGWHLNVSNQQLYTWYLEPCGRSKMPKWYTQKSECEMSKGKTLNYTDLGNVIALENLMPLAYVGE